MPIDEIKPGMIAKALTVFSGNQIEEFDVEIVDLYSNFFPGRSAILIRLLSEKAVFVGPTSGMSGSPVYIDGKLIGAIAYSFSSFVKDPLMGVTPIGEMLEIFDWENIRDKERAFSGNFSTDEILTAALGAEPPNWELFTDPVKTRLAQFDDSQTNCLPLQFNGFSSGSLKPVQDIFANSQISFVRGGSAGGTIEGGELQPGAAIAAVLLSGDMDIAATGTVTWRSGDRVLGFGHPFFDNGPVELPMAQARIMATMASMEHSSKMSLTGKIVGTLRQDRKTGVMGEIGPKPPMVPVQMKYIAENGKETEYHFDMAQEQSLSFLSPLIVRIALISGVESARLATGYNTLEVTGAAKLQDGRELRLDNFYPGYQPTAGFSFLNSTLHSTGQIAANLSSIANNSFVAKPFSSIDVTFKSIAGRKSAVLEKIWLDKTRFSPGDTLTVYYRVQPHQKEAVVHKQEIVVPASWTAKSLTILAGGAQSFTRAEKRNFPAKFKPDNFDQLFDLLQASRKNNQFYIQLVSMDNGVFVGNKEMPGLPPSVYPLFKSSAANGDLTLSRFRVVKEYTFSHQYMIEGIQQVRLRME
ncbi:hypothetical protein KC799_05835 [candidate division KSB1 bacterium]|nr:hypothetical protein [candidate division KSB1 bacterium]